MGTDLLEGSVHARDDTNPVNVERTGEYSVTYRAINSIGLWNDDSTCRYGKQTYTRTVVVIDTLKPVITLKYSDAATLYSKKSNQASNQHTTSGSNPNPNDHPLSVNGKNPADSYSHTYGRVRPDFLRQRMGRRRHRLRRHRPRPPRLLHAQDFCRHFRSGLSEQPHRSFSRHPAGIWAEGPFVMERNR